MIEMSIKAAIQHKITLPLFPRGAKDWNNCKFTFLFFSRKLGPSKSAAQTWQFLPSLQPGAGKFLVNRRQQDLQIQHIGGFTHATELSVDRPGLLAK